MAQHFGEHLTIDGYGGDPERLDSENVVRATLERLVNSLGMHPIAGAQVVAAPDNRKRDPGGWSGVILIAESHISIHTFPRRRFASADVYTCQNGLDVARVVELLREAFGLEDVETNFIKRGLKYPDANCV